MYCIASSYYQHHINLPHIGQSGQMKVSEAKVLVVGAGGLGCPCLQSLSSCGVGTLGIIDGDTVSETNLSRQVLFTYEHVGLSKVEESIRMLKGRNPHIRYEGYTCFLDETNVDEIVVQYDVVVDATDNLRTKYLLNDACLRVGKPLIYGAVFRTEGNVAVFNYEKNRFSLRDLFPENEGEELFAPACSAVGVYQIVTMLTGTVMAGEVLKVLLGHKDVLTRKLLVLDALSLQIRCIGYGQGRGSRDEKSVMPGVVEVDYDGFLADTKNGEAVLIDVRTAIEHRQANIGGDNIPLEVLLANGLDSEVIKKRIYLYCASGYRSRRAALFLQEQGALRVCHLRGGLNSRTN